MNNDMYVKTVSMYNLVQIVLGCDEIQEGTQTGDENWRQFMICYNLLEENWASKNDTSKKNNNIYSRGWLAFGTPYTCLNYEETEPLTISVADMTKELSQFQKPTN